LNEEDDTRWKKWGPPQMPAQNEWKWSVMELRSRTAVRLTRHFGWATPKATTFSIAITFMHRC